MSSFMQREEHNETIANPDHYCRYGCGTKMPLPEMYGKFCPGCGYQQPTLDQLKRRVPEPVGDDPNWQPSLEQMLDVDLSESSTA